MKKNGVKILISSFLFFLCLSAAFTQDTASDSRMVSTQFDMKDSPQWAKDLRRAEIITFGSFPFMYFFSNIGVDLYRFGTHGRDRAYAPWPVDSFGNQQGSVPKTKKERFMTVGIAAGFSVLVAIIDYRIVLSKRSKQEREMVDYPPGTPIIIRSPMNEDETEIPEADAPIEEDEPLDLPEEGLP